MFSSIEEVKNDIQIVHLAISYVKIFNNLRESGLSIFDQILSSKSQPKVISKKNNIKDFFIKRL